MKCRRQLRIMGLLLTLAMAQALAVLVYWKVEDSRRAQQESTFPHERLSSTPRPDLTLMSLDGSTRGLRQLRGKAVLLHFWATWCPPCREELPGLLELGRELAKEAPFQVVAVSLDTDWAAVREFFAGEVPAEIVRDQAGSGAETYGVTTLPDTLLLSPDGLLRLRFRGARDWKSKAARDALLGEINGGVPRVPP